MIQFNLLPDVKLEYLKARRTKQLVVIISFGVTAAALALLILLFITVHVVQRHSLNAANDDIAQYSKELKAIPNLDKILTVQNQLNTLTSLHDKKPVVTRLFGYVSQLTPATVSISSLATDYTANTMLVTGEASSLDQLNLYADTLKVTTFTTKEDPTPHKAFSDVVLSSFARNEKGATYTISLSYEPTIFSSESDVTLTVPNIVTSAQQQLFQKQTGKQ